MLGERRKGYQRRIVLERARGHRVLYGRSLRCCVEPPHPTSRVPDLSDLTVWVTPRVCVLIARLVDFNLALAQVHLGQLNLLLEFGVCLGNVVEGEDCDTQAGEEVAGEDDKSVEGKLDCDGG